MDSKRFNIYAGSILGGLLLFLLLNFFSKLLYFGPEHAGQHEEVLAFAVPVEQAAGGGEQQQGPDWGALLAKADPEAGAKVFNKCKACHSVEKGKNGVGPSLYGIIGEKIAEVPGYDFSDALKSMSDQTWDFEKLTQWLQDPQSYAPGTKMSFNGLNKPEDIVNVIAYLNQNSDHPAELKAPESASAEGGGHGGGATSEQAQGGEQAGASGGGGFDALLAKASAEDGKKVFNKCRACHSVEEGKNGVGPSLYGIIGEKIAEVPGYDFSDALKSKESETWTLAKLDSWLTDPQKFAPGTKMTFPGLKDAQDRINVLTYIDQADGKRDLPEPSASGGGGSGEATASSGESGAAASGTSGEGQPQAQTGTGTGTETGTETGTGTGGQSQQQAATSTEGSAGQQESGQQASEKSGETAASGGGQYADLLAKASADNGKKVFRKCQACHSLKEGENRVGPSLYDIIGEKIAEVPGYDFSDALKSKESETWTLDNLMAWLEDPNAFAPGNKMPFPGLKDAQDRIDVLTYIDQANGKRDLPR